MNRSAPSIFAALITIAATLSGLAQEHSAGGGGGSDMDASYAAVLSAMKLPGASGVLVTELGPNSPAGAAGVRAGDIIVKLNDHDARHLAALRQIVADLLESTTRGIKGKVALIVARAVAPQSKGGGARVEDVTLQMAREPLGIRAIEVAAGVPAKLNPPPSPRGSIAMAWDGLRKEQGAGEGDTGVKSFFRTSEADGPWIGWEERFFEPVADDAFSGKVAVTRINARRGNITISATDAVTFRLRTGDYKTTPAFFLESADAVSNDGYASITTRAVRMGATIRAATQIAYPTRIESSKQERRCPADALPPAAIPLVAAAMPHRADAVLGLHYMSARDFVSRPGYVLATRGKQPLPPDDPDAAKDPNAPPRPKAWRVDLMQCGAVLESYWFGDQRQLLRIDTFSGTTLVTRRVAGENDARAVAVEKYVLPK